jgi:IS66 Orf2 like protein
MIPVPSGVRVWIATGHTDMRRGMNGLALQVEQALKRDPHAGDLFAFRGRRGRSRSFGMMVLACRFTPRGSSAASSFGPRQLMALSSSRRRSSLTCWKASTGDTRSAHGGQKLRAERAVVNSARLRAHKRSLL